MTAVHILIAEDEKHVRLTLGLTLRQAGYKVTMAENGMEALATMRELADGPARVDLLITDIQMPHLDGLALMDSLQETGISIPMVGITGLDDKKLPAELRRRGCREYLGKPFTPGEVLFRVEKVLEQNRGAKIEAESRCRLRKGRFNLLQEGRNYQEDFRRLWTQFDSAVDAYRSLISQTAGTEKLALYWHNLPLAGLGGDYLGIRDTEKGCDILLADVAGHDMDAFFHAVLIKDFFENWHCDDPDLQFFFKSLNLHLLNQAGKERLVKAVLLRLDLEARQGCLISAAQPPLITDNRHCRAPRPLPVEGSVLGIHEQVDFSSHRFPLLQSDRYFLCSDGVLNARRQRGQQESLGLAGLAELARKQRGKPIKTAVQGIWKQVLDYCGQRPHDDMVLLGLEIPA